MSDVSQAPPRRRIDWVLASCIAAIAFAVRLSSLLHAGGFHAILGYDEGVYFGAATSFVNGLMPYRDFVLVHPPGSVVMLSPFAVLGRFTTDSTGWQWARVFIMLVGATNAALLYVIARRISLVAGVTAGLLYAVWAPVVHVERTTMLEAFVLLAITVALWAVRSAHEPPWRLVLAGVALGLGTGTKLWGAVPLLVIGTWLLGKRSFRSFVIVTGSALAALAVLVTPFLIIARGRMVDLVILAQIDRGRGGTDVWDRLARMFNVDLARLAQSPSALVAVGVSATIVVVALCVLAWVGSQRARLWVSLLAVQWIVLLTVPVYFEGYSSFIAPALMLTTGAATATMWSAVARWPIPWRPVAHGALAFSVAMIALVNAYHAARSPVDLKPRLRVLAGITNGARCVGSDSAGLLIVSDTLSRNIQRACPTVVDFDGTIYAVDGGSNPGHLDAIQRRRQSATYQEGMRGYFAGNDVVLLHRAKADAFDRTTRLALHTRPLIYRQPGLRVFGS